MTNKTNPFALTFLRLGRVAGCALKDEIRGTVVAVFKRCFYLELASTYVCVGNSDFSDGPLNIVSSAPSQTNWTSSGLGVGDRASVTNSHLKVGTNISFSFVDVQIWTPVPSLISPVLITSIELFYATTPSQNGLPEQASPLIAALLEWLKKPNPKVAAPIKNLLGMGPGLTPSGDDFIAAMLITLYHLKQRNAQAQLANAVIELAPACTNPISAQHLYAAIEGLGSDAFHQVLQGDPPAFGTLTSIGHSSGWDALAGLYMTLKVCQNLIQHQKFAA